jgi:hypothetical protein
MKKDGNLLLSRDFPKNYNGCSALLFYRNYSKIYGFAPILSELLTSYPDRVSSWLQLN